MRPKRLQGVSYVGARRYSLCFCTYRRQTLFVAADVVTAVMFQIERTCQQDGFELLAYCFMPDHVHLLLEAVTPTADLRKAVGRMKQKSGYEFSKSFHGRLWQDGYFEHVLRNDEATRTVIRYIVDNPVRAGLVQRYEDYPFLGGKYARDFA